MRTEFARGSSFCMNRRMAMRVAQINVTATLSTGRIAVGISQVLVEQGHKGLIAFSRGYPPADMPWIRVGSRADMLWHGARARLTDRVGFYSKLATRKLVKQLRAYRPDVVHLHNLHGYYLHLPTLFHFLRDEGIPVVWTLHDCWAYTGHCAYYTMAPGDASRREGRTHRQGTTRGCDRWKKGCSSCPQKYAYPSSLLLDQSGRNWAEKRRLFTGLECLFLVTPSQWLQGEVRKSFLGGYPTHVIPNGIDIEAFRPCEDADYLADVIHKHGLAQLGERKLLLGVASTWDERKGLRDFEELAAVLGPEYWIVLVGLSEKQRERLPLEILGIGRLESIRELCAFYTVADLYVSLSHEETMGMTLIEAMACGTQVLCYDATALPENVTEAVGSVVPLGNVQAVAEEVQRLCEMPKSAADCCLHAKKYDKRKRFVEYVKLYEWMLGHAKPREPGKGMQRPKGERQA